MGEEKLLEENEPFWHNEFTRLGLQISPEARQALDAGLEQASGIRIETIAKYDSGKMAEEYIFNVLSTLEKFVERYKVSKNTIVDIPFLNIMNDAPKDKREENIYDLITQEEYSYDEALKKVNQAEITKTAREKEKEALGS